MAAYRFKATPSVDSYHQYPLIYGGHIMRQCGVFLAFLVGSTLLCVQAEAAIYTDLTSWESDAGTTVVEDFNGETAGAFSTSSVTGFTGFDLSIATLSYNTTNQTYVYNGDYVGIATATSSLGALDDSQSLAWTQYQTYAGWGDAVGNGNDGPTITLLLAAGTTAVAFDWLDMDSSDVYQVTISGTDYYLPPFTYNSTGSGFFGIVSDVAITSITFSHLLDSGEISEGFAIDNVRTNAPVTADVPEPISLAVWGVLGGLGMVATRRRKKLAA